MPSSEWDPTSSSVLEDQCAAYDEMRRECPVAYSEYLDWSLFRHDDVVRVLEDHETFTNVVSEHRSVPNGLDPPEHTIYRRAIEPYFSDERMEAFEPVCRRLAAVLVESLTGEGTFDCVEAFATPFALRCQCAFLGWPDALAEPIRQWTRKNQEATLAGDRTALAEIAREFRSYVDELLDARRGAACQPRDDVTSSLMRIQVNDQPITDEDLTSILRNWTVGEVGSLAAAIGIVAHYLAVHPALQARLRAEPSLVPLAIEEILRATGPLVSNRRLAKREVTIGGRRIPAGDRLSLMWIAADRDERVFERPTEVRLDRDLSSSLLWGAGIHVCPGAPLARLEMRIAIDALLARSQHIEIAPRIATQRAVYPANGWRFLPLRAHWSG